MKKTGDVTDFTQTSCYNGAGQRIRKTEKGKTTHYFYDQGTVLYTLDGSGEKTSHNLLGLSGSVAASRRYEGEDGDPFFLYNKDIKGSTTSILKEDLSGAVSYVYDDFGVTEQKGDTGFYNEVCYTGGIYDDSTALYYLNARYYDPSIGRFLSEDTYRGEAENADTWHLYVYCANNPVNYVDPSGHWVHTIGFEASVNCIFSALYSIQIGIDSKGYINFSQSIAVGAKISNPSVGSSWVYSSYPNLKSVDGLSGKTFNIGASLDIYLFSISGTVYVDTSVGKAGVSGSVSKGNGIKVPSKGGSTYAYRVKTECSRKYKISSLFKMIVGKTKTLRVKGKTMKLKREKMCISFKGGKIQGKITKNKDFRLNRK